MNIAPAPMQTNGKSHRACASVRAGACSENSAVMISTIGFENERRLEQSGVTSSHWWSEKDGESCETYYHRNQQFSITAVTTSTGAVTERYAYSAYGEPTVLNAAGTVVANTAIANRYTYTGREWDSTVGLYHFRARWMSPKTGRFLTRDPKEYDDSDCLYEFLRATSLHKLDPEGTSTLSNDEETALSGCSCAASTTQKPPKGAYGWVECKDEKFVPVVNEPQNVGNSDCFQKCGIDKCIKEHEEHHVKQLENLCPNACKDQCGNRINGAVLGFSSDSCRDTAECFAHKVEMECLNKLYWDHKAKEKSKNGVSCIFRNPNNPLHQGNQVSCSQNIKNWWFKEASRIATDPTSKGGYGCKSGMFPKWQENPPKKKP
jgi:RHS repeat-associated protein